MDDKPKRPDRPDRGFRPNVEFGPKQSGARSAVFGRQGVFKHQDGKLETLADAVDLFWNGVERSPADWSSNQLGYDYLVSHAADANREDVRKTLNWIEAAIARRKRDAVIAAARYLQAMPDMLLAADYGRLSTIFNSRILGMVWTITPDFDVKPLPPRVPKFGQEAGFGLIRSTPQLYLKLAMFGHEMEEIVTRLVEEALRYGISLPAELADMARKPQGGI